MITPFCLNAILAACAAATYSVHISSNGSVLVNGGNGSGVFIGPRWGYFQPPNWGQFNPPLPPAGNQPPTQPIIEDMEDEAGNNETVVSPIINEQEDNSDSLKSVGRDVNKLMKLIRNPRLPSPSDVLKWILTLLARNVWWKRSPTVSPLPMP